VVVSHGLRLAFFVKSLSPSLFLPQSYPKKLTYRMGLGFFAGSLASVVNIPYDVAKSRIQGPQPVPGQIKYYGAHKAIFTIYKEEG